MGLDERLAALAEQRSDEAKLDVEAALVATRRTAGRRRAWRRGALAVAAAVVLVSATVVGLRALGDDGQRVTAGPAPAPVQPPPAVDRSKPHLWLSASAVPPAGADLAVIIVDPTAGGDTWGVAATVQRWDGERWVALDRAKVCLDFWACTGEIGGSGDVEDIGLDGGSGMGPLTWLRTGRLDPGWYRLVQTGNDGTVAAGQFEVRPGAPAQPPRDEAGKPHLSLEAPLRLATMSSSLAIVRPVEEGAKLPDGWDTWMPVIQQWNGTGWTLGFMGADLNLTPTDDPTSGPGWSIDLGNWPPGAYRLVLAGPTESVEGRFWVEDPAGG